MGWYGLSQNLAAVVSLGGYGGAIVPAPLACCAGALRRVASRIIIVMLWSVGLRRRVTACAVEGNHRLLPRLTYDILPFCNLKLGHCMLCCIIVSILSGYL